MSMQLIDSHCHLDRLDLSKYDGSLAAALDAAREEGIERFFNISIDTGNIPDVLAIADEHADVFASVGVHPNEDEGEEPTVEQLVEFAKHPKVLAIGETGLDYFRSEGDLEWQRQRFRNHIEAAKRCEMPLIIHSREAREDTLKLMREEGAEQAGGIMHCFVEDLATAEAAMEMGFYISFSGIVTFKNAQELKEVAKRVPDERLLIETDSPYLAPVPNRGKPNQPLFVKHVAECLAELRGSTAEEIGALTSDNFYRLFPRAKS